RDWHGEAPRAFHKGFTAFTMSTRGATCRSCLSKVSTTADCRAGSLISAIAKPALIRLFRYVDSLRWILPSVPRTPEPPENHFPSSLYLVTRIATSFPSSSSSCGGLSTLKGDSKHG